MKTFLILTVLFLFLSMVKFFNNTNSNEYSKKEVKLIFTQLHKKKSPDTFHLAKATVSHF